MSNSDPHLTHPTHLTRLTRLTRLTHLTHLTRLRSHSHRRASAWQAYLTNFFPFSSTSTESGRPFTKSMRVSPSGV